MFYFAARIAMRAAKKPRIPVADAARLLLSAQGLYADPRRRATRGALLSLIDQLGFVQVDSINVVARAHDLTLWSRLHGYRPGQLLPLLEGEARRALPDEGAREGAPLNRDRRLFEHWTHDASIIPTEFYAHWKPRFRRDRERIPASAWWRSLLGERAAQVMAHVKQRIADEGPLSSADFEHDRPRQGFWDWKPEKAALEFLWRVGELSVARRVNFQKLYDLTERIFPDAHARPEPDDAAHVEWICMSAAERLVLFTARELCAFWNAVELPVAQAFCTRAAQQGRIIPVEIELAQGGPPQQAWALSDYAERLAALPGPESSSRVRLLCPFDPVLRDRARCLRRFGFDYRFEAFTPPAKRQYGYYVLPILEGDRLIGRLDPKLHRDTAQLEVRALYFEPGVRKTQARKRAVRDAAWDLATFLGATQISGMLG
jgi:uncharacterized protein YcaQ